MIAKSSQIYFGLIYGWQVSLLSPASTVRLWPIDYKMILSNCQHTSIFISVCFFPKLLSSSSSFTWGLASVVLMSGRACWELSSATEAGVGTLLSILAAAWDNFEEKGRNHNADGLLRISHWLNFCVLRIDFQWHSPKAWCYFLLKYWSTSLPCMQAYHDVVAHFKGYATSVFRKASLHTLVNYNWPHI